MTYQWGTKRSVLECVDPAMGGLRELAANMTTDEVAAAVLMAEASGLSVLMQREMAKGRDSQRLAQLQAIHRPTHEVCQAMQDNLKHTGGGDPKVWGAALDRINALSMRLHGQEWVPGVSGKPSGETAH